MRFPLYPSLLTLVWCLVSPLAVFAQGGLKDIPDPSVDAELASFKLPPGMKVNLFASDPMISKPVQMNWDAAGRLWLVSSPMYPMIAPGQKEDDQVLVLEDADGDGTADKATSFAGGLNVPTAVVPGDGGAYVANSTEILFLKDTDGDGRADLRQVVLSGFGTEDTHHLIHTFRFGPEGMLWFNQSIYIHSHVETPYGVRRLLGGGMWHFRPETRRLEVFMKGLVNPWGHVFDHWGQSFMSDGAGFQGMHFVFPRSVFMTSPGATRILAGMNPGQPKHCSLEMPSGRHVPEDWVGTLIAPDFRGNRINRFRLAESGSQYTSTQVEDVIASTHRAFRPIDVKMGPDGAIYVADWYNPIIQHGEVDFRDERRDHVHGRIWRLSFEGRPLVERPKIVGQPVEGLLALLDAPEEWTRHFARQELRLRGAEAVMPALEKRVTELPDGAPDRAHQLLDAIWTAQGVNQFPAAWVRELAASTDHRARAAALRAVYYEPDRLGADDAFVMAERAVKDSHPQVRLWGVSLLAQLDHPDTVKAALACLDQERDEYLDFALWSLCREHAARWIPAVEKGNNPFGSVGALLFAVRSTDRPLATDVILSSLDTGEISEAAAGDVATWLAKAGDAGHLARLLAWANDDGRSPAAMRAVFTALADAAKLRRIIPSEGAESILKRLSQPGLDTETYQLAAQLSGEWKLEAARAPLEQVLLAADKDEARARAAMAGLVAMGGPGGAFFDRTATDHASSLRVRSLAVVGRTSQAPNAGAKIAIAVLQDMTDGKDPFGVFDTFLRSKAGPEALRQALQGVKLPREIALTGMKKAGTAPGKPEALVEALRIAGDVQPMKAQLTPEELVAMVGRIAKQGNAARGESVFRRAQLQCTVCHAIGGSGPLIGPDLVSIGASAPVDYLIESLLEPGKKIKEGYHTTVVTLKNGNAYAGSLVREDAAEAVVRDAAGVEQRIPKTDIASLQISPVSLMPPGLTAALREDEFVDLVRFLSELGKEGPFKVAPTAFVRSWQVLESNDRFFDATWHAGAGAFAVAEKQDVWRPVWSRVAGDLLMEDLPDVRSRRGNWAGLRFTLDASKSANIRLKVTAPAEWQLFRGNDELGLPKEGPGEVAVSLTKGSQVFVLGGPKQGGGHVQVELIGAEGVTVK